MSKKDDTKKGGILHVERALFHPGMISVTAGVNALMVEETVDPGEVVGFLARHISGDWGNLDAFDKRQNEDALCNGSRIFSAYRSVSGEKFWVITDAANEEGMRETTCVLLPDEY